MILENFNGFTEKQLLSKAISTRLEHIWKQSDKATERGNKDIYEKLLDESLAWSKYCHLKHIQLPMHIASRF